ncbi:MAG: aminoacyl-tRNA hydrolase, partial [bacterium]
MIIIAGLGNPGPKYQGNRHNIGFMAADEIARRWSFGPERAKFQSVIREGEVATAAGPVKVLLMKPQTFMNESGRSIRAALDWYRLDPSQLLVLVADMDLPLGRLRLRASGSAGGHNGLR